MVEIPVLNDKDEDEQLVKGTKDWEELLVRLKQVLDSLRARGLTLKISKCVFESDEIDYFGFKIAKGYLQPGEVKQKVILGASTPTDVHSAERLTCLTEKERKFTWGVEQQEAFGKLRKNLTVPPVLKFYSPLAPMELRTGASIHELAGMILQQDELGRLHLVFCTMTARYLRAGQPAQVPQLVTAAVSSLNLSFYDNGTARPEQEEADPAVAAASCGNASTLETPSRPDERGDRVDKAINGATVQTHTVCGVRFDNKVAPSEALRDGHHSVTEQVVKAIGDWFRRANETIAQAVEPSPTSQHHVAAETTSHNSSRAAASISLITDDPASHALDTSSDEEMDTQASARR
ncbi:hypothetical protein MRX96_001993 [Rhipicephalus microplus]